MLSDQDVTCKVSQFGVRVRGNVGGSGVWAGFGVTEAKGNSGGGGGNSRVAAGACRPDDAHDLAQKSWVRSAMRDKSGGWPRNIGEGASNPGI